MGVRMAQLDQFLQMIFQAAESATLGFDQRPVAVDLSEDHQGAWSCVDGCRHPGRLGLDIGCSAPDIGFLNGVERQRPVQIRVVGSHGKHQVRHEPHSMQDHIDVGHPQFRQGVQHQVGHLVADDQRVFDGRCELIDQGLWC
ncbi:hypothetical protein D9M68_721830 [compost metagenome]